MDYEKCMYTNNTKIYGILGFPLGHTLSPLIHNYLFDQSHFNGVYLVFERRDWPEIGLAPLQKVGIRGLSVTIPFKEWAFQAAGTACETSQRMKASNTLLLEDGKITAKNTDGEGALQSILTMDKDLLSASDSSQILILGSGGSAKGILYAITDYIKSQNKIIQKKIRILARNEKASIDMINSLDSTDLISNIGYEEAIEESKNFSLILHTTPIGMKGIDGDPLLPKNFFHKHSTLFDIVYNPLETELVKFAKAKKANIIPGYSMLLFQAIRQFEYFTGIEAKKKWVNELSKLLLKKLKTR